MGRALIQGICRDCAGFGEHPAEGFEMTGEMMRCERCDGSGDEFGAYLDDAYRRGRSDQLMLQREALRCFEILERGL